METSRLPLPANALAGQKVLVTAGGGFIGSRVVRRALACGASVSVLVRPEDGRDRLSNLEGVRFYEGDILDEPAVTRALAEEKPNLVVHTAGLVDSRREPSLVPSMMRLHALGMAHLLEASRLAEVAHVVALGSSGEYGASAAVFAEDRIAEPVDPYSVSKLAATDLAMTYDRAFGLPCTVVRPFVVYGPGELKNRIFSTVFGKALAGGGEVDFTAGEQVRDFVYVDDVAEGILRAALTPAARGQILNLGIGRGTRVRDAVTIAIAASQNRVIPLFGKLPYRPGEPPSLVADNTKIEAILGWSPPTSVEEGVALTYAAFVEAAKA